MTSDIYPPRPSSSPDDFLNVARRIASRICADAVESDRADRSGWLVRVPDYGARERRSRREPASCLLYQGVAGIAYFLSRAYVATGEAEFAEKALGGLRFALEEAQKLPEESCGFHSGRVGIAWVAAQCADPLQDPSLARAGLDLLLPLKGRASQDRGLDVVAGAAGAIPALLDLQKHLPGTSQKVPGTSQKVPGTSQKVPGTPSEGVDRAFLLELAVELGEHLLATAVQEPDGWSWATIPNSSVRNLVGFAHGVSGIALALLELAHATGRADFRFASDMAFVYERQFLDAERDNWPDLRNVALGEMLRALPRPQLREVARAGGLPRYGHPFMSAWCHGSPGVGLAHLRAWKLTGRPQHLDTVRIALRSTLASLLPEALELGNFSLCHGGCGNAELPLEASQILQEPDLKAPVVRSAERASERHGQADGWPCGTFDGASDPSLLVGEAGIGLHYLRLADPSIPSPLLLHPQHDSTPEATETYADAYTEAAERYARSFFGRTAARWHRLGSPALGSADIDPSDSALPDETPARQAFRQLEKRLASATDLERDAAVEEHALFLATTGLTDFSRETVRSLERVTWPELLTGAPLNARTFRLAEDARLLVTDHDWASWDAGEAESPPEPEATAVLLHRRDNRMVSTVPAALTGVVLQALAEPLTLDQICDRVAEALGGAPREKVRPVVEPQLEQLYGAGLIDVDGGAGPEPVDKDPAHDAGSPSV